MAPCAPVCPVSPTGPTSHVLSPLRKVEPDLVPVAVNPVVATKPVAFVNTAAEGVPNAGVVKVGLVSVLFVKVCEPVNVATVESMAISFALAVMPVPPITFKVGLTVLVPD